MSNFMKIYSDMRKLEQTTGLMWIKELLWVEADMRKLEKFMELHMTGLIAA